VRTWDDTERDRVHARVSGLVAALPEAYVEDAYGHAGCFVNGKRFAWLLVDHHDDGRLALCVKAPPGEQEALAAQGPRYFRPAYLGPKGWVGVNLDEASNPDWDEVAALLEQAWRLTAGKRAVAAYDGQRLGDRNPDG
jgi:hypothetical protein